MIRHLKQEDIVNSVVLLFSEPVYVMINCSGSISNLLNAVKAG
jgi:hypothetical protein